MTAVDAIAAVEAATDFAALDALQEDETRVTVLSAIAVRREALAAGGEATDEATDEGDGLVEVTTRGEVGTSKTLSINGVASSIPCGVVLRVSPEVAEQLRQCSLL